MAKAQLYTAYREPPVEAMRLALDDPMVAEKDLEEHNRAIGAWVFDNDGYIRSGARKYMVINTAGGETIVGPGQWIVKDGLGIFSVWTDEDFTKKYKAL